MVQLHFNDIRSTKDTLMSNEQQRFNCKAEQYCTTHLCNGRRSKNKNVNFHSPRVTIHGM